MHFIISLVFALALLLSYLSVYNNAVRLVTRTNAGVGLGFDLIAALSWGLFYYLTH